MIDPAAQPTANDPPRRGHRRYHRTGYAGDTIVELDGSQGQAPGRLTIGADKTNVRFARLVVHSFNNGISIEGGTETSLGPITSATDVTGTQPSATATSGFGKHVKTNHDRVNRGQGT